MKNIMCVYSIMCGGKRYIGATKNFKKRIKIHYSSLISNIHYNDSLQNSFNKTKDIKVTIIKKVTHVDHLTRFEIYYIGKFDSFENGHNGVIPSFGNRVPSEEVSYEEN